MTPRSLFALACFLTLSSGCGVSGGSGLTNTHATAHAPAASPLAPTPVVYGSRTALSDPREAPARVAADPASKPDLGTTVVAKGDTVLKIAKRHNISVAALMSANNLTTLALDPGRKLVLPKP